jgi:hypothetical protein
MGVRPFQRPPLRSFRPTPPQAAVNVIDTGRCRPGAAPSTRAPAPPAPPNRSEKCALSAWRFQDRPLGARFPKERQGSYGIGKVPAAHCSAPDLAGGSSACAMTLVSGPMFPPRRTVVRGGRQRHSLSSTVASERHSSPSRTYSKARPRGLRAAARPRSSRARRAVESRSDGPPLRAPPRRTHGHQGVDLLCAG